MANRLMRWRRRYVVLSLLALVITAALLASLWLDREMLARDIDAVAASTALSRYAALRASTTLADQCAGCHGARLGGDVSLGAPNLTDREWLYGEGRASEIEQTLEYGIRSGHPKSRNLASMPAYARARPYERNDQPALNPGQIDDVVAYLRLLQSTAADGAHPVDGPVDAVAAERGRLVFNGMGSCFDCHAADAAGDNAIGAPSLRAHAWLHGTGSAEDLHDVIAYGRAGACPAWGGRLAPATLRAVAVTVHLRSHDALAERAAGSR